MRHRTVVQFWKAIAQRAPRVQRRTIEGNVYLGSRPAIRFVPPPALGIWASIGYSLIDLVPSIIQAPPTATRNEEAMVTLCSP